MINEIEERPLISIVIPVNNAEQYLERLVQSLNEMDYPKDKLEIIFIDNNSLDNSVEIIKGYQREHNQVRLLFEREIQSPAAARNKGISAARGDILAFVDADEWVAPDWIVNGLRCLRNERADLMGGQIRVSSPNDTIYVLYDSLINFAQDRFVAQGWAATANLFVFRHVFEKVGGFNPNLLIYSEDNEFGTRAAQTGYKIVYCDRSITYHPARERLLDQLIKAIRMGRGRARYSKEILKRPRIKWFISLPLSSIYVVKLVIVNRIRLAEGVKVVLISIAYNFTLSMSYIVNVVKEFLLFRR